MNANSVTVAVLAVGLLVLSAMDVHARLLEVQTQVRYDFLETKDRGEPASGDGRFSTSYNLLLRRPFIPSASLVSELRFDSSEVAERVGRQSNKNWTLNLYARQPKYTLIGRINRNDYRSLSGSQLGSSSGYATSYNASLLLREPAYPVVNLQYLRNVSGSSYAGSDSGYTTSTWLLSTYYDMVPLRFTYDRTRQKYDYSGSSGAGSLTQRSSVVLNHTFMPGLTLSGELSKYMIETDYQDSGSKTSTGRRLIRLSATPTRSVAMSLDYLAQSNEQGLSTGTRRTDNDTLSFNVRSQVLPGLALDYSDQRQSQAGSEFIGTTSRNRNMGFSARLSSDSSLTGSMQSSEYNVASGSATKQDSNQLAFQTALTSRTDLSLVYGRTKSVIATEGEYSSNFAGISVRDRSSNRLSIGASYRRSNVRSSSQNAASYSQTNDVIDVDALWLPSSDLGINLRLSYQANNGGSISEQISPSVNCRWQLDSSTNLSVSYTQEETDQWDWTSSSILGQKNKGMALRVTHSFADGSSLDVSYDFHGSSVGQREWERQLRMYFTTRL